MARIRAWACGLRRILPISMPGAVTSAPNLARPVTLSTPSGRSGRVPTTLNLCVAGSRVVYRAACQPFLISAAASWHRAHDLVVTGAAAEIAGQPEANLGLGRIGVALEQRLGRDQEARRADAALQGGMLEELALQRMQLVAVGDALDGAEPRGPRPRRRAPGRSRRARPSSVTLQAPQSPVPQPSLLPVRPSRSRSTSSSVSSASQRYSTASPLIVVETLNLETSLAPRALASAIAAARRASTPATLMRNSLVPRLSSIGRQAAEAAAASSLERRVVDLGADQRLGRLGHQQHALGDRARARRAPPCRRPCRRASG